MATRPESLACHRPPIRVFTESYMLRGEPDAIERLYCNEHGWLRAVRWRIDIGPAPEVEP